MMKKVIYIAIAATIFAGGMATMYKWKYRPLRTETITLRAENEDLKLQIKEKEKTIKVVWENYVELAKLPRYQIDQHLGKVKMRHGSKFNFTPNALMSLTDSVKSLGLGDSIVLKVEPERPNFWQRLFH